MRLMLVIAVFSLLVSFSYAAFVYGEIYKAHTLEKINDTIVKIDGRFSYQLVIKKSNYSIDLPNGDYTIYAEHLNNGVVYSAKEEVKIGANDQRIDLALFPSGNSADYLFAFGLIIIGLFLFYNVLKITTLKKEPATAKKPKGMELDEDAKKVLQTLESFEGRATQKELKDSLNFSDAKLSLILSELENMQKIKKFKRGRGNIIRKI